MATTIVQLPPAFVGEQAVYGLDYRGGLAPPADHWAKTAHPMAPWPPGPLQQFQQWPLQQWCWAPASPAPPPIMSYAVGQGLCYQPAPATAWIPLNQAPYEPVPPQMFFHMPCPQYQPATPAWTPAPQAAMPIPPPPPPAHFPPPLPPTQAPLQAPEAPPTAHPASYKEQNTQKPRWADLSEEPPKWDITDVATSSQEPLPTLLPRPPHGLQGKGRGKGGKGHAKGKGTRKWRQ
ncbi:unnamed protein product [Symbiodinium natans]|uniref:Uncharacterized protein n=1 Tax=Symbiodinium natans TaxID=878477 RepID=A0A812LGE5_9DINO|nr:unnamed protein product [Symbiodinium natans]